MRKERSKGSVTNAIHNLCIPLPVGWEVAAAPTVFCFYICMSTAVAVIATATKTVATATVLTVNLLLGKS